MNRRRYIAGLIFAISICIDGSNSIRSVESQEKEKTADQVYKNLQVFKGLTASQLLGAMNFMAGSLGVSCNHCHVPNQFAKDDKPSKQTARQHLQMMRAINDTNFAGNTVINCATCHRGEARPESTLILAHNCCPSLDTVSESSESLPSVDQILDKYFQALGGRKKFEKLETVTVKGTRETRNGTDPLSVDQLEIYRKVPNKLLMNFKTSGNSSSQAFNGMSGWRRFNGRVSTIGGADLLGAKRDADFYKDINFKDNYPKLVVVGREMLGGREAFVIEATLAETHPARAMFGIGSEKLYFDTQSGLLIRRSMEYQTPLGALPEATDYEAYRKVKGMMFPFTIRLSRPPMIVTQKLVEIEINARIDDAMFELPAAK